MRCVTCDFTEGEILFGSYTPGEGGGFAQGCCYLVAPEKSQTHLCVRYRERGGEHPVPFYRY